MHVIGQGFRAFFRALLVASLIATPGLLLPRGDAEMTQMVALLGLIAGALVFVEYRSSYPSFIEFRNAAPYNRLRFAMAFAIVLAVTLACRGTPGGAVPGAWLGDALDFPFSPVRLMVLVISDTVPAADHAALRAAAGLAYGLSLAALVIFAVVLRLARWPLAHGPFNVWVNLPMVDPTAGGDILRRFERDAHVNVALGFLLPFLIPAALQLVPSGPSLLRLADPQTAIWVISLWGILPAALIMRGVALMRIADLIAAKRRRAYRQAELHAA
ncbi:hypothetical protein [Citreimonas salinaria]|uniref:Uncharacterized protein n=1 Tax=Citreimonas salinaria TaxID=321339 RepID=A0A1H3F5F7_9RHOB|nr:hypothetical protein [Citreimonas salinaria]SDX86232.1 hypothetical protein SAMN05444340_101205 [Citreimonas salinaria]